MTASVDCHAMLTLPRNTKTSIMLEACAVRRAGKRCVHQGCGVPSFPCLACDLRCRTPYHHRGTGLSCHSCTCLSSLSWQCLHQAREALVDACNTYVWVTASAQKRLARNNDAEAKHKLDRESYQRGFVQADFHRSQPGRSIETSGDVCKQCMLNDMAGALPCHSRCTSHWLLLLHHDNSGTTHDPPMPSLPHPLATTASALVCWLAGVREPGHCWTLPGPGARARCEKWSAFPWPTMRTTLCSRGLQLHWMRKEKAQIWDMNDPTRAQRFFNCWPIQHDVLFPVRRKYFDVLNRAGGAYAP